MGPIQIAKAAVLTLPPPARLQTRNRSVETSQAEKRPALKGLLQSDTAFPRSYKAIIGKKWETPKPPEGVSLKPVPNMPNVWADADGEVWTCHRGIWYKHPTEPSTNGYPRITIRIDGKKKSYATHLLVATAYHGKCPEGMQCRHLDDNPLNNRPDNLAWGTHTENMEDRKANAKPLQSIEFDERKEIVNLYSDGLSKQAISRKTRIKYRTILMYLTGKSYTRNKDLEFMRNLKSACETVAQEATNSAEQDETRKLIAQSLKEKSRRLQELIEGRIREGE